jgi:peptide/nickel transport system substrate-binding protein
VLVRICAAAAVFALVATACGGDDGAGGGGQRGGTLVFGSSSDPVSLDGAFVSDGESIRIIYQVFEGLVRTKDGGFDPVPSLAKSWTTSPEGTSWTFELQQGVKFHDGTDFNAEAVCFNFNRWYNFRGPILQSDAVTYYYVTAFGGFSDKPETSLYESCEVTDADTVKINLTKPSSSFLAVLTLPAFSMQSPAALRQYEADKVSGAADAPKFEGSYGLQHPTGTGPFKFESFAAGDRTVLVRNEDYWGTKALLDRLIFRAIADNAARRQALETNEIQVYENPEPGDINTLKSAGFNVAQRSPFNVGYVGFNVTKKPLDNLKIRQAIAHALNREALLKAKYPPGAQVATQFQPPELFGWADDVATYDYDVDRAKQLIAESGVANPTLEFWYPTAISRGYMPDPPANFQAFKADLEAVGFRVVPKSAPWRPDYLNRLQAGGAPVYLFGWLADFGDPDNFVGTFFQQYSAQWGFRNQEIFSTLDAAERETDQAKRAQLYQEANRKVMEFLPGVPYVHTSTFMVLGKNVRGFVPSPINLERYSIVSLTSAA